MEFRLESSQFWPLSKGFIKKIQIQNFQFRISSHLLLTLYFSSPLVMQCCPCSGPTTTISALFTDAPNAIDISEISTIDYEDVTDQTMFLSDDDNLDDNLITTTEFEGLY